MRINHNIAALNTHRQLSQANNANQNSMEKLSSGLRINRAGDDAAGLAISEKMRGQIRGLEQSQRNAQDGISLIQTGEGALNETHSILQRMRELAVQSSNDTNTSDDRAEIQKEVNQLTKEIDRISNDTEFNNKKLLNGSISSESVISTNNSGAVSAEVTDPSLDSGDYTASVSNVDVTDAANFQAGATNVAQGDVSITGTDVKAGSYSIEFSGTASNADVTLKDSDGNELATATGEDFTSGAVTVGEYELAQDSYDGTAGTVSFDTTIEADVSVTDPEGNVSTVTDQKASLSDSSLNVGGFDIEVDSDLVADDDTISVTNNAISFQIGANEGQNTKLAIGDMSSSALGVENINVETQAGADAAISTINDAIQEVSSERSKLGANQNRLEHTINNLGTSAENLTAAESRIRDVDMAKEMMNQTKQNILAQASQSMLAKANQQPQGVLQLLR